MASSAAAVQVCDDIAAELNGANGPGVSGAWANPFKAQMAWFPVLGIGPDEATEDDAQQLTDSPIITVIPDSSPATAIATRGLKSEDVAIFVVLQVKVAKAIREIIDPWVSQLQELCDYYSHPTRNHVIATSVSQNARCVEMKVESYCFRPHLKAFHVYTGALALTVRIHR